MTRLSSAAKRFSLFAILWSVASVVAAQTATEPKRPSLEALEKIISDRTPKIRVNAVDHERITAKRIDIVGDDGTIRMTLSANTPPPIIDGIQYRRAFGVSGLILYDAKGSERGGFGVADTPGGTAAVLALDHPAMDAVGWRVSPDGSVAFTINQAPPLIREPGLDNKLVPGVQTSTRVKLSVAADGTPAVALSDANDQARVRMTVTPEGYGAIEFLDASGKVIHVLAPERDSKQADT
ncbi:hypothetical protein IP90_00760 [Luteimonas cucumeris]|uniref:Uncharacterized protein n=1 Tax=Luteimonas cucumeris TaxID=985012 RepID=A0A562LAD2_9GAMM|nr:hypothetical protein [Luteimonas cucumeris]TWI04627.1 hypothetical protein IP90_00760 [Luteimonas cucumeris]